MADRPESRQKGASRLTRGELPTLAEDEQELATITSSVSAVQSRSDDLLAPIEPIEPPEAPTLIGTSTPSVVVASNRDSYRGATLDDRYVIDQLLGEGGMGYVYSARHKVIDKQVAIKILRSDLAQEQEMAERFLNEAKSASSIGHPHIVDISDFGRLPDGAAYFVMEFLDGPSLSEVMTRVGVVPVPRLVHIAKQIARGLQAAHNRGIVHRDLKPDNVMLVKRGDDADFVKVLDFGIAKVAGETHRLTRAGSVFGTPHYMSPEQAAGVPVDLRTDIYSLGVILYEMASGKVPFDADNFMGILTQHMYKAPAPFRVLVPQPQEIPPGLEAIVLKCLSKKIELRYQTMDELISDLEKAERGAVPDAVSEMMGRSGGFNVPADYFRNPGRIGGAAMLPATPRAGGRPRSSMLVGVLAGTVLLFGIVAIVVAGSSLRRDANATPVADPIPASPSVTATVTPSVQAAPSPKMAIIVTTEPIDSTIAIHDDREDVPRKQPRMIELRPDEHLTLRIEHAGYRTQHVIVDGAKVDPRDPRIAVKLEPVRAAAAPAGKPAPPPKPVATPAPAPAPAPPPPPAPTVRPSWCRAEDWDPFLKKCSHSGP